MDTKTLISRDAREFVVGIQSTYAREPEGFIAQFPDGGVWKRLEEKVVLWRFDADTQEFRHLADISRPKDIHSGLRFLVAGWDEHDRFYLSVSGNQGDTSDTPVATHYFQVNPSGGAAEIDSLPDVSGSFQQEALANSKLLVTIDIKPGEDVRGIGVSRNYKEPFKMLYRIQPDGSVERL